MNDSTGEPRKETLSQGGGVLTSFSGGDEHSSPENVEARVGAAPAAPAPAYT
jgi:hypothetical protein